MKLSNTNIYLIGFSGSGKTTIGNLLAKKLHAVFIDTDAEISKQTKKKIEEIFKENGETYFRKLEEEVIIKVSRKNRKDKVISLGGGAFQSVKNREFISKNGISVYLSCSQRELYRRLKDKTDRPLLNDKNNDSEYSRADLKNKIRSMISQRMSNYKKAYITVSTSTKTKSEIVDNIQKRLKKYAGH